MEVLQCPVCDLRFRNESELDQHIAIDHPDFHARRKSIEDPTQPRRDEPEDRPRRT
jgi:uncharacterized C2H2 Zn-finger protein